MQYDGRSGCREIYRSTNGRETEIQDLNSSHLANILRKLERSAQTEFQKGQAKKPDGTPVQTWRGCLPEIYVDLVDEALYRGINWERPEEA